MTTLEFADLLETTDKVQCYGTMFQGEACCAMGLAALAIDPNIDSPQYSDELCDLAREVRDLCGVSISFMNDVDKMSFKSIGKHIREKQCGNS